MNLTLLLIFAIAVFLLSGFFAFDAHLWRRRHHDHLIPGTPRAPL